MFKQRLLTTLVLVPLILIAIYYGNLWVIRALVLLLVVMAGVEWMQLIPLQTFVAKLVYLTVLLLFVGLSLYGSYDGLMVDLGLWLLILFAVLLFPTSEAYWGFRIVVGGAALIILPVFASTMLAIYQHDSGKHLIVYLLCLVWATDIGAYLAGNGWGHHKLIPLVSPGKTIEGAMGGLLLAMFVAFIGSLCLHPESLTKWYWVSFSVALISMLGDLFISMLKRRSKLKDTGHIFPGHGGILDRIDSLIAAAPLFYAGLVFVMGR